MAKAIRFHQTGGPEVLKLEDVEVGEPGPGQARVRNNACGLNYIDTYHRSGLYPVPLPSGIGLEGAGVVEALASDVTYLKVGDRVGYAGGALGAYADVRIIAADRLVKVPAGLTDQQVAGMMLKGLTAQYLLRRTYNVKPGDTVLVQAAAGGVGLIMCQWAKHLGATVIGTVSSDDKATLAKANGCDHPIVYTRDDFVAKVKEITGGKGCQVVYDGIAKDTFMKSIDCLAPLGMMVVFGNASGNPPDINPAVLQAKGSLFLTRPTLNTYMAKRDDLVKSAEELFSVVSSGKVKIDVRQTYALKDAAKSHQDLESRKTTGSTILIP